MTLKDQIETSEQTKKKAEILVQTEISQPAILLHSYLTFLKMKDYLCETYEIAYLFGPSLGEIISLVIGNSINLYDASKLLYNRGKFMQESCPNGAGLYLI